MLHTVNPQAVRAIRLNSGLSVTELADLAKVGRVTIYRAEAGTHTPRMGTLRALADALSVPVSALLADNEAAVKA